MDGHNLASVNTELTQVHFCLHILCIVLKLFKAAYNRSIISDIKIHMQDCGPGKEEEARMSPLRGMGFVVFVCFFFFFKDHSHLFLSNVTKV